MGGDYTDYTESGRNPKFFFNNFSILIFNSQKTGRKATTD